MKNLFLSFILLISIPSFAFESKITLSTTDLKKNYTIAGSSPDEIPIVAARVLQLQIRASGCKSVMVNPLSIQAAKEHSFSITSDECVIKNKQSETCDGGFSAKNFEVNPNTPEAEIAGADQYKVCIKSGAQSEKGQQPR